MTDIKKLITSLALGDKDEAASTFNDLMQNKVKSAVDTKTVEVADKVYNNKEETSVNESAELSEEATEDALYEYAIDGILEDETINISEMSDEEIEKILEDRFNTLSEKDSLLKKIGKGIASRVTVSGRADRAAKKAEKGEKKIADRAKLMKAKATMKAQKALRKAQKAAKRAGKPVPRGYQDAGIEDPEIVYKKAIAKAKKADGGDSSDNAEKAKKEKEAAAEKAKKEKEAAAEKAKKEKEAAAAAAEKEKQEKEAEEEKEKAKKDAAADSEKKDDADASS